MSDYLKMPMEEATENRIEGEVTSVGVTERENAGSGLFKRGKLDQRAIVTLLFIVIAVLFSIFLPGFATAGNLINLLRSVSVLGILGLGMGIVVIGRGVDLSMVALMAVPTALILSMTGAGMGVVPAMVLGFALAIAVGVLNGVLVAYADVPSLFVTLASGIGLAGIGQSGILSYDQVPWPKVMNGLLWLGGGEVFGIPSSIITFAVLAILVFLFLRFTKLGMFTYTIGDNPFAARTIGIPVRPIQVFHYVLAAIISVIAGLVMASSSGIMDTRIFNGTLVFDVVLVVVLGGVGLSGGRGGVMNVILGALLIGLVSDGMTIMGFSDNSQKIVKGIVLLVAIFADSLINPRNEDTAQQGNI